MPDGSAGFERRIRRRGCFCSGADAVPPFFRERGFFPHWLALRLRLPDPVPDFFFLQELATTSSWATSDATSEEPSGKKKEKTVKAASQNSTDGIDIRRNLNIAPENTIVTAAQ